LRLNHLFDKAIPDHHSVLVIVVIVMSQSMLLGQQRNDGGNVNPNWRSLTQSAEDQQLVREFETPEYRSSWALKAINASKAYAYHIPYLDGRAHR